MSGLASGAEPEGYRAVGGGYGQAARAAFLPFGGRLDAAGAPRPFLPMDGVNQMTLGVASAHGAGTGRNPHERIAPARSYR